MIHQGVLLCLVKRCQSRCRQQRAETIFLRDADKFSHHIAEIIAIEGFFLDQEINQAIHAIALISYQVNGLLVAALNDGAHLLVDLVGD